MARSERLMDAPIWTGDGDESLMDTPKAEPPLATRDAPRVRVLPLIVMAGMLLIVLATGLHRFASLDALVEVHDRFKSIIIQHRMLAMAAYLAVYVGAITLSLPGAVIFTLTAGLMFGWLAGGVLSLLAATLGGSIVFAVARTTVGEALAARAGPQVSRLRAGFCDNALSYMLFLRLIPAFPFFAVNIVPALLGVPFRTFLIGTFFGIMPASFAYSSAGAGLESAIFAARSAQMRCLADGVAAQCPLSIKLATLLTPELMIALVLLSLLALTPVGLRIWRRHGH